MANTMSFEAFRTFFAVLSLGATVAAIGGAALLSRTVVNPDRPVHPAIASVRGAELKLAFVVATTATLGSLYLSEIAHLEPCRLCWFQRIAMYPLALVLGMAAWRRDHNIRPYGLSLAAIGGSISIYHYLVQRFPGLDTGACDVGVPCSAAYFWMFGFMSIPYMALSAFTLVAVLLLIQRVNETQSTSDAAAATLITDHERSTP